MLQVMILVYECFMYVYKHEYVCDLVTATKSSPAISAAIKASQKNL